MSKDFELVRRVLKIWQRFAYENRWGGLHSEWEECKRAIESLDRIRGILEDRQMRLPGPDDPLTPDQKAAVTWAAEFLEKNGGLSPDIP